MKEVVDRVLTFMAEAVEPGAIARRDDLARMLCAWQLDHNADYRAMVDVPISGARWPGGIETIPAVPVALFKDLELCSFPVADTRITFRTSGTTGQRRGVVRLPEAHLYETAARLWFSRCFPDAPTTVVSLCPPGAQTDPGSDSSLGWMVDHFAGSIVHCFRDGALDAAGAWAALNAASGPSFLASTAFALDALLAAPGRAELGPDSLVMVTGGFKGRRVRLDAAELYRALPERLGAPRVVGEYGMSELASQLWTEPVPAGEVPGAFRAPPWLYVYAVDPLSGEPVTGEGLLRFVDLANVYTVIAIETLDLGVVERHPDGDRVTLKGRLEGAEARGCSIRAETLLERTRG